MKIMDTVINPDETVAIIEIEVADNYYDPPAPPQQTDTERIAQLETQNAELSTIVDAILGASLGG